MDIAKICHQLRIIDIVGSQTALIQLALSHASKAGRLDLVKNILSLGATIQYLQYDALYFAIEYARTDIVKLFISQCNRKDYSQLNAKLIMQLAVDQEVHSNERIAMIKYLVQIFGMAIMYDPIVINKLIDVKNYQMIEYLMDYDPHIFDFSNDPRWYDLMAPFVQCIINSDIYGAKYFLSKLTIPASDFDLAFKYAACNDDLDTMKWLQPMIHSTSDALIMACVRGNLSIVQYLFKIGDKIRVRIPDQHDALYIVIQYNHMHILKYILWRKYEVFDYNHDYNPHFAEVYYDICLKEFVDTRLNLALNTAVKLGRTRMVHYLMQHCDTGDLNLTCIRDAVMTQNHQLFKLVLKIKGWYWYQPMLQCCIELKKYKLIKYVLICDPYLINDMSWHVLCETNLFKHVSKPAVDDCCIQGPLLHKEQYLLCTNKYKSHLISRYCYDRWRNSCPYCKSAMDITTMYINQ
jgi:ankyrin repeat protein